MQTELPVTMFRDEALEERLRVIKIWDAMFRGARHYVQERGFVGVHNMPELVGITGACENVDTLFKVDFFGKRAYLAQSDQLYLELLTPYLGKVYAEMQSFRMEPDADDRHLCQFSLFEIEHLGGINVLKNNIKNIVSGAVAHCLPLLDKDDPHYDVLHKFAYAAIPTITYTEAVEDLRAFGYSELQWGDDLKANHEKVIADKYGPCFIQGYPKEIKFFNMKANEIDERIVNSCDLILPYAGESAGAAERETDYDKIVDKLKTSDMYKRLIDLGSTDEDFEWYLEAHRGKNIPLHSGAGIGMARVAQFILGKNDIRECVPFLINKENLL